MLEPEQEKGSSEYIIWRDPGTGSCKCMFQMIHEVTDLNEVREMFDRIADLEPALTYDIIHHRKDGEGIYDIFRFSKFSYMEHCNRVKATKTGK